MNKSKESDILLFNVKRGTTNLFKHFLSILQRQKEDHEEFKDKLRNSLPSEFHNHIELADPYSDTKAFVLRKEVLDKGNDAIRNFEEELNNFEIKLK